MWEYMQGWKRRRPHIKMNRKLTILKSDISLSDALFRALN